LPGARRFYSFDPAGNRVEFLTKAREPVAVKNT
jgi:hypothetical protein